MKEYYNQILNLLKDDARISIEEIAKVLNLKAGEVEGAIDEMIADGIIVKYSTIVNGEKLQQDAVSAFIEVRVTPQKDMGFDQIAEEIAAYKEVKSLYLMSGGYDLAVIAEGSNLREISNFVHEKLAVIDNVTSTATHFMLKCYKLEGVLLDGDLTEKRLLVQP